MNLDIAKKIVKNCQDLGVDVELRESYSGRGMYGGSTTGLVGSLTDIMTGFVDAACDIDPRDFHGRGEIMDVVESLCIDDMGLDKIIY